MYDKLYANQRANTKKVSSRSSNFLVLEPGRSEYFPLDLGACARVRVFTLDTVVVSENSAQ
jgi:hypothetical protein